MTIRKSYPRNPLERHGIIGGRLPPVIKDKPLPPSHDDTNFEIKEPRSNTWHRPAEDCDPTPRHTREGIKPKCVVIASKRIGFGATEMKMSQPMTLAASELLCNHLNNKSYIRYRVNIYSK